MNPKIKQAFESVLSNWNSMSGAGEENAEATADEFESSFYQFIETLREWFDGLENPPHSLDAFMELPMIHDILDQLPGPLYLNFETEAELILENKSRIDDEKYD